VAQAQAAADQAKESWRLEFEQWSDPRVEIARHMNSCGMANIEIDETRAVSSVDENEVPGGPYEVGMLQPGIVVVPRASPRGPALLSWSSVPHAGNIGGAIGRPSAKETWAAVQAALRGEKGFEAWSPEGPGSSEMPLPMPLFYLALFAHGNFVRPKPFILDAQGKGHPAPPLMRSLGKVGVVVGGSAVAAATTPSARGPVLGLWLAWAGYAYFSHRELFVTLFKVGVQEPPRPP
jgi:hypothetical protein